MPGGLRLVIHLDQGSIWEWQQDVQASLASGSASFSLDSSSIHTGWIRVVRSYLPASSFYCPLINQSSSTLPPHPLFTVCTVSVHSLPCRISQEITACAKNLFGFVVVLLQKLSHDFFFEMPLDLGFRINSGLSTYTSPSWFSEPQSYSPQPSHHQTVIPALVVIHPKAPIHLLLHSSCSALYFLWLWRVLWRCEDQN